MKKSKRSRRHLTWAKNYKGGSLAPLDRAIVHFLWKWKVAPIAVLREALALGQNPNTFNKRMRKLERNGLIHCQQEFCIGMALWELTENGFFIIRESLGAIRDHGFHSASRAHDLHALAFQFGEWIWEKSRRPILITDQELLKYPQDILSELLPESDGHRPDGYTLVKTENEHALFAIEVELHAKSVDRYHSLIKWYAPQMKIQRVLWLVGESFVVDQFRKAKVEAKDNSERFHLFVSLDDYKQNGWDALLSTECSERVGTLREILRGQTGQMPGNNAGNGGSKKDLSIFYDHRKFLRIKRACAENPKPPDS